MFTLPPKKQLKFFSDELPRIPYEELDNLEEIGKYHLFFMLNFCFKIYNIIKCTRCIHFNGINSHPNDEDTVTQEIKSVLLSQHKFVLIVSRYFELLKKNLIQTILASCLPSLYQEILVDTITKFVLH